MTNREDLIRFYQENPRYFASAGEGSCLDVLSSLHERVRAHLRTLTHVRICEFGCGTGEDLKAVWRPENTYTGLDVSHGALAQARERLPHGNVRFLAIPSDGSVSLPDASQDVVMSFFVFEHVLEPDAVLRTWARLLAPGGHLFIVAPNYGSPLKSAPPLGTPSKVKLIRKGLRILGVMARRLLRPLASIALTRIPLEKLQLGEAWGPDMDATCEPWSWEVAARLKGLGMRITEVTTWEGDCKTGPERVLWPLRHLPLIRHLGPLLYIHAKRNR